MGSLPRIDERQLLADRTLSPVSKYHPYFSDDYTRSTQ